MRTSSAAEGSSRSVKADGSRVGMARLSKQSINQTKKPVGFNSVMFAFSKMNSNKYIGTANIYFDHYPSIFSYSLL